MAAELGVAKKVKTDIEKKPKWSFGSVRHWDCRNKVRKKKSLSFRKSDMPIIKRIEKKEKTNIWFPIVIAGVIFVIPIFGYIIGIPLFLVVALRSIYKYNHPKSDYTVEYKNEK